MGWLHGVNDCLPVFVILLALAARMRSQTAVTRRAAIEGRSSDECVADLTALFVVMQEKKVAGRRKFLALRRGRADELRH